MKYKLIITTLACSVVIISGVFIVNKTINTKDILETVVISADYPKYDTLDSLVDKADTIVKGRIVNYTYSDLTITQEIDSDNEYLNPGGEFDNSTIPYTVYMVEIEKAYKGDYAMNDVIEVKQLGGILGNTEYVLEDGAEAKFKEDHNYVFFLETYPDSPASLLNPLQASYEYDDNDNIVDSKQRNEDNKINFTMQELDNMMISK